MRIRSHLVLTAAASLLPMVLAAGLALDRIRSNEREIALRGLRETVRATSLLVDREAQGALSALRVLGNSPSLKVHDFAALHAQASSLNRLPDVWTVLLDAQGRQLLNTHETYGTPASEVLQTELVKRVGASGTPEIGSLEVGPQTGRVRVTINVPVTLADGERYVFAQAFSANHWQKATMQSQLPSDWIIAVIDRGGRFIARSHMTDALLGKAARPELVEAASRALDGMIEHATVEGVWSYDAFSHSSLTGWTVAVAAPVVSIDSAGNRSMLLAAAGLLVAVVAAFLSAAFFGRRFTSAIDASGRYAFSLGRGQTPQVQPSSIAEIDALNQHLLYAGKLLDSERESRVAAEAERERLLQGERLARESAQAQNAAKDQFLALLGHELRNPLAAIAGATALLNLKPPDNARDQRARQIIQRQNRHLSRIVDDLLDASRLMAGKIVLELKPLNLAECVHHCVEAVRASAHAQGYHITARAQEVWVSGDAVRMEQILNNLLNNALKFSLPDGTVEVSVQGDGGMAVVQVRDAGVGMDAELLRHIFEPFVQGPAPADRLQSGMGIGLSLVQQLVALHGGTVEASSAGAHQGSLFTLRFSAVAAAQSEDPQPQPAKPVGGRLVYVEDNQDARESTAQLLRMSGYEVVEVGDGAEAVAAVISNLPDLVMLDLGLPGLDGHEIARRLRANPLTGAIPLIALSGYGPVGANDGSTPAAFDAHLVKPVDAAALEREIARLLARAA